MHIQNILSYKRGKRVYISFLISYLAVLCITAMSGVLAYIISAGIVEKEINTYNLVVMKQIQENMDREMEKLQQLYYQISTSPTIRKLAYYDEKLDGDSRSDILTMINELKGYRTLNQFSDFYIYFNRLNMILNYNSIYDPAFFYKEIARYNKADYNLWFEGILNDSLSTSFFSSSTNDEGAKHDMISYVQSIPYGRGGEGAKIVFVINENEYMGILKDIPNFESTRLYIVDSKNKLITSSGKDKKIPDKAIEKSGFTYMDLNGEKVVIVSAKSQVIDWTYNIIIPQYVFFQKVTRLKNVFIFMELIAIIIGFLISGFFTYRNYIPIREIMEAILKKHGGAGEIGNVHTEYEYIKSSILSSIDETNSLKSAIEGYKSMLKINLLVRLIKGEVQDREFNGGIFGSLDIHLNFPAFAVMILQTPEDGAAPDNADIDIKKTIEDHLKQIPQKPVKSYSIELEQGKYIMILCFSVLSEEEIIQCISEFTGFLEKIYMNRAKDDVRIAVGRVVYDPRQIFNSFRDADREQTQKYDYQEGNEAQVTKSSLSEQIYYYSMDMEVQLSNMARSGNIEDVKGMLEKIYERNFVSLSLSTQMARFLFVAVLNTAFSIIYEMQIELRYNPMEAVMTANKADDMYHTIQMIFTDICRLVKEKEKTIKDNEKRNIIVFIQENLYNMNLSLTLIADEFHMTPSGVYRIIKEQTGEGFVDLVNKYRLCEAKQLLESTNLLVAEIAQKSGYQSDNSFIRAFKKYTGITPGQYREMSAKSTNRSFN